MARAEWHDINDPGHELPFQLKKRLDEEAKAREEARLQQEWDEQAEQQALLKSKKPEFSQERWSHSNEQRAGESPNEAFEGDEIILEAKWKDMVAGSPAFMNIREVSQQPYEDLLSLRGRLSDGVFKYTWKVVALQTKRPNPKFAFEPYYDGSYGKKYGKTTPIDIAKKTVCPFSEIPDSLFCEKSAMSQLDKDGILIGTLCAILQYAKANPDAQAIVCGHAAEQDTGVYSALEISKQRAIAIKSLLSGDGEAWIDAANDFSEPKDIQQFLATLSENYGWDCNPGAIDGKIGSKAKAAIKKYKSEYNKRFSGGLADTDAIDCETFRSIFAVLRSIILEEYKKASGEPALPAMTWGNNGAGQYACGTAFPPDAKINRSKTGARVEICFLAKGTKLTFTEHTDKATPVTAKENPIYGGRFERKSIEYKEAQAALRIKDIDGPRALAHNQQGLYTVKSFNRKATDEEKKSIGWVTMIDGKEVERHENVGEKFEFLAIGKYAGEKITVHPFLHSPSSKLCITTTIGQCLLFDGKTLSWLDETLKQIKQWPASSGDASHTDKTKDGGPIPDGRWVVLQSEHKHTPDGHWWQKLTNAQELKEFGADRIKLLSFKSTATHGRNDFYIHGGKEAGSSHGIDLTGKMKEFLDEFVKGGKNLVLVVKYGVTQTGSTSKMRTSENGKRFIMEHEGFRSKPYNDTAGHATIGYGTLLHKGPVTKDDQKKYANGITEDEAKKLLDEAIVSFEDALNKEVRVQLSQNQFDALMSWTYNFGPGAIPGSTWCKELNAGNYDNVPDELKKWHHVTVNGKKEDSIGLMNRRKDEADLFAKK